MGNTASAPETRPQSQLATEEDLDLPTPQEDLDLPTPQEDLDLPTPQEDLDLPTPQEDLDLLTPQEDLDLLTPQAEVGVGITLDVNSDGSVVVHSVCEGGSAENRLQPGDVLLAVGGKSVQGIPAQHMAGLLLGPSGSKVDITVSREAAAPGELIHIFTQQKHQYTLTRKRTDPRLARTAIIARDAKADAKAEPTLESSPATVLTVAPVEEEYEANREPSRPQLTVERPPTLNEEECAKMLERGDWPSGGLART